MHDIAIRSVAVPPSSARDNAEDVKTANTSADERNEYTTASGSATDPSNEVAEVVGEGATDSGGECSRCAAVGNGDGRHDFHVVRSPVMLEFGAELPGHAASACGRAVQFPIPNGWDDPEVNPKMKYRAVLEITGAGETKH